MNESDILMEDIRKALELMKEEMPPNRVYKFEGGWVETDGFGAPVKIGLDPNLRDLIKDSAKNLKMKRISGKIKTLYGIKVVEDVQ